MLHLCVFMYLCGYVHMSQIPLKALDFLALTLQVIVELSDVGAGIPTLATRKSSTHF